MAETKSFLIQTRQAASFALREYFRPLVIACRFLKSKVVAAFPAETGRKKKCQEQVTDRKGS